MEEPNAEYNHRLVFAATLCVTAICISLTVLALQVVPTTPGLPFAIHLLMLFGWVTGFYLSLTLLLLMPLLRRLVNNELTEYIQIAHGLQIPIVVIGVGTWAVVKLLGWV